MHQNILISWIGGNDLDAINSKKDGPILSTIRHLNFSQVHLLYNYPDESVDKYVKWLQAETNVQIYTYKAQLSSPVHFGEIYLEATNVLDTLALQNIYPDILLSPGTPAMQAIWILLGKTKYPSRFIQATLEQGVQFVDIPFEIAAEFTPAIKSLSKKALETLIHPDQAVNLAFEKVITRNPKLINIKKQAEILASTEVPILIYGETGTGKELFARAIHNASSRANSKFIPVNCGALPSDLIDSLLFGHKKGAFTGASQDQLGFFREADGGTVFLDEFGELPAEAQVRLLRVLQEQTITPVGSYQEIKINVRIIAATHRNLMQMVSDGKFREDLFYRIAIGVLQIPPLREREGDLLILAENILNHLKEKEHTLNDKYFSVSAKNIMLKQSWPGNIREMQSTIMRAALWSVTDEISESDIKNALFKMPLPQTHENQLDFSQGIDINNEISKFTINCIQEVLTKTGNNKTKAAELLGLKNYQTLNNWIQKYNIGK
jgi:transcriptional regulator with PAS, ATPase and Fis domain